LNPGRSSSPLNALAVRSLRPLGHASAVMIAAEGRRGTDRTTCQHERVRTKTAAWIALIAIVALLVVSLAAPAQGLPRGARVQTYKSGLGFPVDMAWVKGTRKVFFTEKNTGKVRVMIGRRVLARACVNLSVNSAGERGALGIVLHPRFRKTHHLYVFYTNARPLQNRVTRFTVRNNRCTRSKHIVRNLKASSSGYHNGGQLEFAGGRLFVATGEAHNPSLAQATLSRLGKVLRYRANGGIPTDNPFSGPNERSPVWSYGHRNVFGLAHKPGTKRLYATENGPSCDDELNHIRRGRNYGWGVGYVCGSAGVGSRPKGPLFRWSSVVVPTDAAWYAGRMKRLSGSLYVGDFGGGRLHRFELDARGARLRRHTVIFNGDSGILDVATGPRGWLYFLTAGSIHRIVPAGRETTNRSRPLEGRGRVYK
jgi:glucose/arabinose dehydrogenase